jgi:ribosomal protein S4
MLLLKLKKKPEKKKMLQRFFKVKRKKKWRHWRSFKFFFLFRKSLSFFSKLKWLFNQKRILWHYFSSLYGKKFKSLIYKKAFRKIAFGKFFFFIITFLELRLGVLLIRMRFSSKLIESNNLIANGFILVNGKKPSLGVLIVPSCVVQKKLCNQQLTGRRKKKK